MKIIETHPCELSFKQFENLPKLLYPADSIRLRQPENINLEFLYKCYVVTDNDIPKGRAILYKNPYLRFQGMKAMCIGNYESVNNSHVSTKLMEAVFAEARKQQAEFMIGPMNGSTWDNYRFSIHHNHSNFLLEPYHPLYYNEQFKANGFKVISSYTSTISHTLQSDMKEVLKQGEEFSKRGVTIRTINMGQYENELKKLYPFIGNAFQTNFLYTPISWSAFKAKYLEATKIIDPEYVLIAEDKDQKIIGFVFCYDDLFHPENKSLIAKTIARNPSKQWTGLGHVLLNRVSTVMKKKGYKSLVNAFLKEDGTSTLLSQHFGTNPYKNYVLYGTHV